MTTTNRSVDHASFTIERTYDAAPERVWRAFADPATKMRWFAGPEEEGAENGLELDFRVGGTETISGGKPGGPTFTYRATYHDIVEGERFVTSYTMDMDDTRLSVSVATFELAPAGGATKLTVTEHGAFLDGNDDVASRKQGTEMLLDQLAGAL